MSLRELLTEDETREVMGPYQERLAAVLNRAFARWRSLPPEHAVDASSRSRASLVHDYIAAEATSEFLGDDHVTVSRKRGTVVLVFAGKVAVRFKKVTGTSLRYCVGPTRRQHAIHNQQLSLADTDITLTWATAAWRLDSLGELSQTALLVNDGDKQQFSFDLAVAEPADVLPLPVADDDDGGLVMRPAAPAAEDDATRDGTGTR